MTWDPPEYYRQSSITRFDACPLSARFQLEDTRRTPGPAAAGGTLFHRFGHQAIKKMWELGERTFPIDMGLELLGEVLCQRDVPPEEVVPISMNGIRWQRILVVKWCTNTVLDARRTVAAEERFFADLVLPIGETVRVTGQLDLLLANPPNGLTVVDWKTGWRRPPTPRSQEKAENEGTGLTSLGWAQWLIYSYLMFMNFPSIQNVWFREVHVLWGEERQARMDRRKMEQLTDSLATQVSLFHQAVKEGPDSPRWMPSAGAHCSMCSRPRDCPIKDAEGIPADYKEAQRMTQEWIVAGEIRKRRSEYVKGWVDQFGPIEVPHADGRRVVGYELEGSRSLKLFEPKDIPVSPYDGPLINAAREAGVLKT